MKMTRTFDDETDLVSYSIPKFPFQAVIKRGALPPSLRAVQITDAGGIVKAEVFHEDIVEEHATRMLFEFFKDNLSISED